MILKPDPGRPQELYLGSLEALGIDVRAHDVRFVEDNWENPTLGAWGLGWEVWMDGGFLCISLPLPVLVRHGMYKNSFLSYVPPSSFYGFVVVA